MKLLLIRHGEPDYTIDSLTEKGWKEAELLAERISKLDVKYCANAMWNEKIRNAEGISLVADEFQAFYAFHKFA